MRIGSRKLQSKTLRCKEPNVVLVENVIRHAIRGGGGQLPKYIIVALPLYYIVESGEENMELLYVNLLSRGFIRERSTEDEELKLLAILLVLFVTAITTCLINVFTSNNKRLQCQ